MSGVGVVLLVACAIALPVFGLLWAAAVEKRDFNNGKCRTCGADLVRIDTDSQGGRFYVCSVDIKHHSCWVNYLRVDREFRRKA